MFRRLDYALWRQSVHNPVLMLQRISQEALDRAAADPGFLAAYDAAVAATDAMRAPTTPTWWQSHLGAPAQGVVAYFCAEFALHQSLPIYAGGLGVLAGDHCKEASDLGIPIVGVGFMYPQGYFRQRISTEGWQQEHYERINWDQAPIERARTIDGQPCVVLVPIADRSVLLQVWMVRLGRVRLLLLDTDLEQNAPWDRELSARLYGGGPDTRLQQEIILGLGGVLALRALGYKPAAWHLNEGHAAFVVLQRLRDLIADGQTWEQALVEVRRTTVFTTHTPVPAGHDAFPFHLVEQHLSSSWGSMNGYGERFLALGNYDSGAGPQFNMTALAMRSAGAINAVSELHGDVTREMFAPLWPDLEPGDRPVGTITNGVHVPTWVATDLGQLFERHLSPAWREQYEDPVVLGPHPGHSRRGAVGGPRTAPRASVPVHSRAGAPAMDHRPGRRRARGRLRRDAGPHRAHDRVRAPLHGLQAAGPRLPRSRSPRAARVRRQPAGAVRLRRQGASGRRVGQASPADHLPERARLRAWRAASRSSTTTISTSRICSCRAATCGSTIRASRSKRAARAA